MSRKLRSNIFVFCFAGIVVLVCIYLYISSNRTDNSKYTSIRDNYSNKTRDNGIEVQSPNTLSIFEDEVDREKNRAFSEEEKLLDSHARMLILLERIRMESDRDNVYVGEVALNSVISRSAELETGSKIIPDLRIYQAIFLRNLGRNDEALSVLLELHDILRNIDHPRKTQVSFEAGLTYLRLAEDQNCVDNHTSESCILPIRGGGVHADKNYALQAIEYFKETLTLSPNHTRAIWLMNISAMAAGVHPDGVQEKHVIPAASFESQVLFPKFHNVAVPVGLGTMSLSGGSIADDLNGDDLLDIVVSGWGPNEQLRIYLNTRNGTFIESSEDAGIMGILGGLNLNQADYDNDGDVDIFVMRGAWLEGFGDHPNSLLQNDGTGHFRDVTFDAGLGNAFYPTQTSTWGDFDNDGHLDLFVGNERNPCQLFSNNGDGTFTEIAQTAGIQSSRFTKAVMSGDYDNDRYLDLYVSNLGEPNQLFHNNGDGTFTDVAPELGVTEPTDSFPGWFWDFNNDGALDIYVAQYSFDSVPIFKSYMGQPYTPVSDRLYRGDGQGGFKDVTIEQRLNTPTMPMGSNFGDLDNDGYPDFYLGTGNTNFDALMPNLMFLNQGGTGFSNVTTAGGFGHLQKGHGVAFADLDNDGDQDVFIEMGGAFLGDGYMNALFENPGFSNHWIKIKLVGISSNRAGIGARIRCTIYEQNTQRDVYKWVNSGGSFGASPLRQEIGLGKADTIDVLEVYWPTSDTTQQFLDVGVDQYIEITEDQDEYRTIPQVRLYFNKEMQM